VWSADLFVAGAASIAENAGLSPVIIGLTIVSLGTSAPEILVSITAALAGSGGLAIGNAVGSNIANIGLVLGITVLIAPMQVYPGCLRSETADPAGRDRRHGPAAAGRRSSNAATPC
jgi:cation:H+ antiporter